MYLYLSVIHHLHKLHCFILHNVLNPCPVNVHVFVYHTVGAEIFVRVLFLRILTLRKLPLQCLSIYSNENISKIAKLTVHKNFSLYSICCTK